MYFDYLGFKGVNSKNYAASRTPTLFLLDKESKIEVKTASLKEIINAL
ncbi:hypothetical protein [Chryseobacterium polytrichastri]|uniref:Thioredoxin-like n=1 Tax=Chryseobacterium polytrichastri TaxID=1302687 RepID=A0A1M6Y7M2_9FLAO|nr:hypothetical protein [Chryseobacterium polytrichastri]SHL14266.1 hypothetical protein SAMN05444267_1012117 [Chryseobacterium polytrichastri]